MGCQLKSELQAQAVTGKPTVVVVTNIPTPYRIPLFNELAGQLSSLGVELHVVFAAWIYPRRKWSVQPAQLRFDYSVLGCTPFGFGGEEGVVFSFSGLGRVLEQMRPAVVVVAGFGLSAIRVFLRRWLGGPCYLIWSGAVVSNSSGAMRALLRRALVSRAAGFVAYGSSARDYLATLAADSSCIEIAVNTVDTRFFGEARGGLPRAQNAGEKRVVLVIGDLSKRKRPERILQVAAAVARHRSDFEVHFVGDGPERSKMENLAVSLGVPHLVRFLGFKGRDEVASLLAVAHCLIFPTAFDVWGLVLVEAMAAGVPCLASVHAGATRDLVKDGVNGFALDFSDTALVAERLEWCLGHPDEVRAMGERAAAFIQSEVTIGRSAEGFVKAIMRVLGTQR
jgi:glycosyltransferase involved in cell wall biosynthesis